MSVLSSLCTPVREMKGTSRHKPSSTYSQRLRALEIQEERQREELRSQYGTNRPPKSHLAKKIDSLATNEYYTLFHAPQDDERVARKLLKSVDKVGVDITTLKPESAKLYVKYEKVFHVMKDEDDEFVAFRKRFLEESRKIAAQGGYAVAAVKR